jgi:hypothetical protein
LVDVYTKKDWQARKKRGLTDFPFRDVLRELFLLWNQNDISLQIAVSIKARDNAEIVPGV